MIGESCHNCICDFVDCALTKFGECCDYVDWCICAMVDFVGDCEYLN